MEYISVPFDENNYVKTLGAKFDWSQKSWYIPENIYEINKVKLQKKYKINKEPIVELIGEDRMFGGNELFVDLIPRTCWGKNVRSCIHPRDWNRVRKFIYERVNYICECCGINTLTNNVQLDAHERWLYDNDTYTQKLVRVVALCGVCHETTHIGLAGIKGKRDEAEKHLQNIRKFTEKELKKHIKDAFELWAYRNKFDWKLDISLIENSGIMLSDDFITPLDIKKAE
jgi:hypothetical protein